MDGATPMLPAISVIVPHINQPGYLERCLESLEAQRFDRPFEIVVVDNGSDTLPTELCRRFSKVRLEQEPVPGPGPARNRGVISSSAPILAFIDADCIADPSWLSAIAAAFEDANMHVLGGDVRIAVRDPGRLSALEAYECIYAYRQQEYIKRQGFSGAGNLAIRRRAFQRVGPFGGIEISEDRDWGRRAMSLGFVTHYVPEMLVLHPARASLDELRVKWQRQIAHDFAEIGPGLPARLVWVSKAVALVASPLFQIPRIVASDRIEGSVPRLRAVATLARIRAHRSRMMLQQLRCQKKGSSAAMSWNRS